jgi:PAS domain S-box-containing protein
MPQQESRSSVSHETKPNNDLLRLVAEQSEEHAILLIDTEGLIRSWNPGAERIFGVPDSEIIGKHVSILFTPEEVEKGVPTHEMAVARAYGAAEDDRWMARHDGSRFWATGTMLALRDDNGKVIGFGKILRNRTDLKEQIETLRNQVEALDESGRRKDVFLATLSHELRNPLSPLSDAFQLLRMTSANNPELEFPLKVIERQVNTLRRLVNDLMDLTRIGAGKIELQKEVIEINVVIQRAVQTVGPLVRERRHRLDVLVPSGSIKVEADPTRLEQVFVNLINNAAKYTPEGGRIWVKVTTEGHECVVRVEDNGIGIPNELLPRIFDLFTQVESSRKHSQGGLGIGLSLVKSLVTAHGGSVQVRSEGDGKGSDFAVRLPLHLRAGAR